MTWANKRSIQRAEHDAPVSEGFDFFERPGFSLFLFSKPNSRPFQFNAPPVNQPPAVVLT